MSKYEVKQNPSSRAMKYKNGMSSMRVGSSSIAQITQLATRLQGAQQCPYSGLNDMEPGMTLLGPAACIAQGPLGSQPPCPWWGMPSRGCASGFCFLPLGPAETRTLVRKYPGNLVFCMTTQSQPTPREHWPSLELQAQECFWS